MNIDSIVSYAIFLAMIVSVVYFVTSIYPHFEYNYFLEKTKYEKAMAFYTLGNNYVVYTKVKCITLPNYFKARGIEVIGNVVISNYSYTYFGVAVKSGNETYIYGTQICFNDIVSNQSYGNYTSYAITFSKDYQVNGIQLEKIYRKWLS